MDKKQSKIRALHKYKKAAERGDDDAYIIVARLYAEQGNTARAKFWLLKALPNPNALLLLAKLYAESRSVRATRLATWALSGADHRAQDLSHEAREEIAQLKSTLSTRNSDPHAPGFMKVTFSAHAKAGLRDIALFIARDNKPRALSFVRELRKKARQIGDMPQAFPLAPRYEHHGLRCRPYRDYLIFYRIEGDRVCIVHILHGARDYEALLVPEP